MYLDFEYYTEQSGVIQDKDVFDKHNKKASLYIDHVTFNRVSKMKELPLQILDFLVALVDLVHHKEEELKDLKHKDSNISSMSNNGISVTYDNGTYDTINSEYDKELKKVVNLYLSTIVDDKGTRILYKGV